MTKFFKPQFSLQYLNGVFILGMNPQMTKALMDEIKNQGEQLNATLVAQIPFKGAEMMRDLCVRSSDFFLRNLGEQLDKTLDNLQQKRIAYESRQGHNRDNDDLPEEDLDDTGPYGRGRR